MAYSKYARRCCDAGVALTAFFILFLAGGCDEDPLPESSGNIVVEAFLFSNNTANQIRVSETLSLTSPDSLGEPVVDAEVTVTDDNDSHEFVLTDASMGVYTIDSEQLLINPGSVLTLEIATPNRATSALTRVPAGISNGRSIPDTMRVDGSFGPQIPVELLLDWDLAEDQDSLFYIVIENTDPDPDILVVNGIPLSGPKRIVTRVSEGSEYTIFPQDLFFTGQYYAQLFRVDKSFSDLSLLQQQLGNDLTRAPSNIENGLGIFTIITVSDSLPFYVQQQ